MENVLQLRFDEAGGFLRELSCVCGMGVVLQTPDWEIWKCHTFIHKLSFLAYSDVTVKLPEEMAKVCDIPYYSPPDRRRLAQVLPPKTDPAVCERFHSEA